MLIRPFGAVRPAQQVAAEVAALPYDVYNRQEAACAVIGKPLSFLNIDRPETQFPADADMYADEVYTHAAEQLTTWRAQGTLIQDEVPGYYIYALTMDGRTQTGLVACCSIDEYDQGVIKKHEHTLAAKEQDRIRHIDALNAQTGPIFLTYRAQDDVSRIVRDVTATDPLYHFVADDGIAHTVWRVDVPEWIAQLTEAFKQVPCAYIADGHHRCASAVKVGKMRREQHPDYTGDEEFNYVMSVLFPSDELAILPYNRVVHDLAGYTPAAFVEQLESVCHVAYTQKQMLEPIDKGVFTMYLDGMWYGLEFREEVLNDHPVDGLDVSLLQNLVLKPLLGIDDPRTSERIDFVGGIRGTAELQRMVDAYPQETPAVAFAMYPTDIQELLAVADAGLVMPPKSTWFEPKLRSGLVIHSLT